MTAVAGALSSFATIAAGEPAVRTGASLIALTVRLRAVERGAERGRAAVGGGVDRRAVAAAGPVPGAERDRRAQRAGVVGIRLEIQPRRRIGGEQARTGVADRAERDSRWRRCRSNTTSCRWSYRLTITAMPSCASVSGIGHVVDLACGQLEIDQRRHQRADRAHRRAGCPRYCAVMHRRAGRVQHRRGVVDADQRQRIDLLAAAGQPDIGAAHQHRAVADDVPLPVAVTLQHEDIARRRPPGCCCRPMVVPLTRDQQLALASARPRRGWCRTAPVRGRRSAC